jgi:primosomal protein N'
MLRGRHRHHLLVKSPRGAEASFERAKEALRVFAGGQTRPRVTVDVDPASMM